ncbi:Glycerate kinase [compost metagenome]
MEVVAELVGLVEAVQGADLVLTGEGRFDAQTLRGKTPFGVARIARQHGVPVIVIAGTLGEGYQGCCVIAPVTSHGSGESPKPDPKLVAAVEPARLRPTAQQSQELNRHL